MVIQLLGTGSIWTNRLVSCALIDDVILLDCPNGLMRSLKNREIDFCKIDICILTHFHADHYFDIPFLLMEQGMNHNRKDELIIIGPEGLEKQIEKLFLLAYPELWDTIKVGTNIIFLEVNEHEELCIKGYKIKPYKMNHSLCVAYGYTVYKGKRTVGFTGDTSICRNVKKIIQKSELSFVDMTYIDGTESHMGVNDIILLKEEYGENHRILPTHMCDDARMEYNRIFGDAPEDGKSFCLKEYT